MKGIFYLTFTDKVIKPLIIAFLFIIGIKKGQDFIIYNSGYSNRADDGDVAIGTIQGFYIGWVTRTRMYFGANITLNRSKLPNAGMYPIPDIWKIKLAQPLLRRQFNRLDKYQTQ